MNAKHDRAILESLTDQYGYDGVLHVLALIAAGNAADLRASASDHPEMELGEAARFWQEQAITLATCAKELRV